MYRHLLPVSALLLLAACAPSTNEATGEGADDGGGCANAGGPACDEDGDGFQVSEDDCNDSDASVNPGSTEICDGLDNNCDGEIDEGVTQTFYADEDEDGFGDESTKQVACEQPEDYVATPGDCDDTEPNAHPGNAEVCDQIDNDCNGETDEGVSTMYYADADADTYGDPTSGAPACEQPGGYVLDATDCDDTTGKSFPGNGEVCDELDNNCDGAVDEGVTDDYWADVDSDGYGNASLVQAACAQPTGYIDNDTDCNDSAAEINPAATEMCDTLDNNCDGTIDEDTAADALTWYLDGDVDTFGDAAVPDLACYQPSGYVADATDCDDSVASTYPGAPEYCDGVDNNCDEAIDEDTALDAKTWYLDADSDAYGNASFSDVECYAPAGYVADNTDCDDGTARAYPGATEYCDGIDNNCDSAVDEDTAVDAKNWYDDSDADSFGDPGDLDVECYQPSGFVADNTDCDDARAATYPGATEYCNTIDDDCNGVTDDDTAADARDYFRDSDADSFGDAAVLVHQCYLPSGYVEDDTDCDDARAQTNPGALEYCNTIDDDCDAVTDEDSAVDAKTWYKDGDSDTYGDPAATDVECYVPTGYVADNTDCNDTTNRAYPGATEWCDTIDNNCDSVIDEDTAADAKNWYADGDSDTYGDPAVLDIECYQPSGYVADRTDCDDGRAATNPGATEYCNTFDDDCDGTTDEETAADAKNWYKDGDSDTYGDPAVVDTECYQPSGYVSDNTDCDDARAATYPTATEYCNSIDDDCDGTKDEDTAADAKTWYKDGDSDNYGDATKLDIECYQPTGYVSDSSDCNDSRNDAYPGADEVCDTIDNDCDGSIDENGGVSDGDTFYLDGDADGFGDELTTILACALPTGYADNYYDCDDADGSEPVVADAVSGSGSGAGTMSSPYDLLQDAIDAANSCVVAYQGTYRESVDLAGKSIDVWGVDGATMTTIDADTSTCTYLDPTACEAAVTIADAIGAAPVLHGFTITGGSGAWTSSTTSTTCADSSASHSGTSTCSVTVYDYCGGGLFIDGDDPELYDLVVTSNTLPDFGQYSTGSYKQVWMYSSGGGLCMKDSLASLDLVDVEENYADQGGGIYGGSSANFTYEHGFVNENTATDGGGIKLEAASATFTNSAILCNDAATDGGGLFTEVSGTVVFVNTVFYRNTSATSGTTRGAEAWIGASTTWTLYNSIVESNSGANSLYGAGTGDIQYSDVYNASGSEYGGTFGAGTGATSDGGQLTSVKCDGNPANDNVTLKSGVGAINGGNPAAAYNDADGSRNDMGVYGGPSGSW